MVICPQMGDIKSHYRLEKRAFMLIYGKESSIRLFKLIYKNSEKYRLTRKYLQAKKYMPTWPNW